MKTALLLASAATALGATPEQWKSRAIYQIITDRTAGADPNCDLSAIDYCGGTFAALEGKLDYIAGMGFDALWISPVPVADAYHGYDATNMTGPEAINANFGSPAELQSLVDSAHDRDMYVMLDVVANHMANAHADTGVSTFAPFNDESQYHDCNGCAGDDGCQIEDWSDDAQIEHCRLAGLMDLDQDNQDVADLLTGWVKDMVTSYGFDGLRIDTVPEVKVDFWKEYQAAAGVYATGEVFNGDVAYVAEHGAGLDAVLSYPMFYTLRDIFQNGASMYEIRDTTAAYADAFADPGVLTTFVDNHDNPRFLNDQSDVTLYANALTYVLTGLGVPCVYYGSEQLFDGGNDPYCREVMSDYDTSSDMYQMIAAINAHRVEAKYQAEPQVERWAEDSFYAFTRGDTLVLLTNVGQDGGDVSRELTYYDYKAGDQLCNIFDSSDCVTVGAKGLDVTVEGGMPKVYALQ